MRFAHIFLALPLLAYSVESASALIGTDIGYRFDKWQLKGLVGGSDVIEKAQNIEGISFGLNGHLLFDRFYVRTHGSFMLTLSQPSYLRMVGGVAQSSLPLDKKHGYTTDFGVGYQVYRRCDLVAISPEMGFSYQNLKLARDKTVSTGTPFVGLLADIKVAPSWHLSLGFDYHFLGFNKADIIDGSNLNVAKETEGRYRGTDLRVLLNYFSADSWSIGIASRFKYLFTNRKDYTSTFTRATMRWITNTVTLNIANTF